jgi:hypothetical protein
MLLEILRDTGERRETTDRRADALVAETRRRRPRPRTPRGTYPRESAREDGAFFGLTAVACTRVTTCRMVSRRSLTARQNHPTPLY